MDSLFGFLHNLSFMLVPLLAAVVLHEYAHGRVAYFFGDPTAKSLGRLTLNPLPHIDMYGSIIVPLIMFLIPGGFIFGWAKPVPIDTGKLHNPKRDMAFVAIAGPLMNLFLAVVSGLLLALFLYIDPTLRENWPPQPGVDPRGDLLGMVLVPLSAMMLFSVAINIVLFAFNLLPIPPLDGSRVLVSILPPKQAIALARLERHGMLVVLGLIMVNSYIPILSMYIGSIRELFFQVFLSNFLS
ncbi:MAG: site-2 protease family protein [Nitrospirota bacterium]|jgi:Zn-dependent protease|nr:site-2 protease family protein [Nitrospirota bacterium]MDX2420533.1 site-2 protease family protein [Nitrospirota bacterium]